MQAITVVIKKSMLIIILKHSYNGRNNWAYLCRVVCSQYGYFTDTLPTDGLLSLASDKVFGERPKFNSPLVKALNQVDQVPPKLNI